MRAVFISYRRADSADIAGRIYDRLVERFGEAPVFKDVDSIQPGVAFADYIVESIGQSAVQLVIIGQRWLTISSGWNRRRLDDPGDYVRLEIETALRAGVPVIPVLVMGATLPPGRRLPGSLKRLVERNAIQARPDPDFRRDMDRVIAAVEYWMTQPRALSVITPSTAPAEPLGKGTPLPTTPVPSGAKPSAPSIPPASAPPPDPAAALEPLPRDAAASKAEKPEKAEAVRLAKTVVAPRGGPLISNEQGKKPSTLTGKRKLVAGMAALLIVLALGGLLTNRAITQNQDRIAAQTSTVFAAHASATGIAVAAAATASYAPTATYLAKPLYPYVAAAPGPDCDRGRATWSSSASGDIPATFTCYLDHTHVVAKASPSCSCSVRTYLDWYPPTATGANGQLQNYSEQVDVFNISSEGEAWLVIDLSASQADQDRLQYWFFMNPDGYYSIDRIAGASTEKGITAGNFDPRKTHKAGYTVQGAKIIVTLDGNVVGSYTETSAKPTNYVGLWVQCNYANIPCSADYANFRVTLL
jgi:hypothetical protein